MTAYNTKTEDDKSRQIRPALFNTAKDGSGTWYFPVLDSNGKLVFGDTTAFDTATGSAAIANATAPAAKFRLLRVELHLSAAPTTSEDFTITLDAGDGANYDVNLYTLDLSAGSTTSLIVEFGKGYEYESDDEIDIAYTNTDTGTYGLRVVYELL